MIKKDNIVILIIDNFNFKASIKIIKINQYKKNADDFKHDFRVNVVLEQNRW